MTCRRNAIRRILTAAMILRLLFAMSVSAGAENRNGLVVEKMTFRDVLRLYSADRSAFGTRALEVDENGVANASKRLAEMFTFTVGLNYTGEGKNYNYFGKDITRQMGEDPYVDGNLLATYSVEITPYRSYALALPEGRTTDIRVYLAGYVNAANGVEPVLHYVWEENGSWWAVKDDNPYYRVSYNGLGATQTGSRTLVQTRSAGNGTARLEAWTSLTDTPDGDGIVHLNGATLVAGQGTANLFGVTGDTSGLSSEDGLNAGLMAVSDFVQGDTTYQTGPLVHSRECYEEGTMHRVTDGEALKAGVTYRFRVVYDEALTIAPGRSWEDIGLALRSEVTGRTESITDFTWYGGADYLTSDKYNPHTVEFTFTPEGEGNGVCTFALSNLVGSESALKAADFHTCTATGKVILPEQETPAESAPVEETTAATEANSEPAPAIAETPAPAATPAATMLPLLTAGGADTAVTRAMLAESLWTLSGRPMMPLATPAPAPADGTDEALTQAIQWCARNGLIGGFAGEAGGPEEIITREQAAVVLQRYAAMQGADVSAYGDLSGWADGDAVSGWARDAVSWALDNGMLGARDDGTLAPQEEAVCADLTGMIFRMQQTY